MSKPELVLLDGHNVGIENLYEFSAYPNRYEFSVAPAARNRLEKSRSFVLDVAKKERPFYSINTGFGALSNQFISSEDLVSLQLNIVRSHAVGVGKPFSEHVVRSVLLILAQSLLKGYSGVSPAIVDLVLRFLNENIVPVVPEKGSVGASGDLAPLAHIAYALIGEGDVFYRGERRNSGHVLKSLGIEPARLGPKDGLALLNGTHAMCGLGAKAIFEASRLAKNADLVCAMSLDAFRGSLHAFDERLHQLKNHPGQFESAKNIRTLLVSSSIMKSHEDCDRLQDPYSFRCAAQVHGAARQTLSHGYQVISEELRSVSDNPIVFEDEERIVSGGHFHGEALALAMDYMAIGVAEFANISERRVEKLLNPVFSRLPAFLVEKPGLNSGLMIGQYTAASLVSENKVLCHPASVDSIPTSNEKEDHVSMGLTSGRKLQEVLFNASQCLAIEAFCAFQAIHLLRPLRSSESIERVWTMMHSRIKPIVEDRYLAEDIDQISHMLNSGKLLEGCGVELV